MAESASAGVGDPRVQRAFALGWNMAQLFHGRIPATSPETPAGVPAKLAGISDLDDLAKVRLLASEVVVGVHRVCTFGDEGLIPVGLSTLRALFEASSRNPEEVRREISSVHDALLAHLTAADFRLGKAYGLGRALAETTMVPSVDHRESFTRPFDPFRLGRLETWLSDLKSVFPAHATEGVRGSLRTWASWVKNPEMELWSDATRQVVGHRAVDWASADDRDRIAGALGRQAQVWRAMLSGEKLGTDLLSTEHYVTAAKQLVDRLGELLRKFFWGYKMAVAGAAVVVVAVVVGLLSVLSRSSAVVAGAAATVGAVGISWKGVGGTLGKALSRAERPLWDAALDASIVIAATRLPQEVTHDGSPKRRKRLAQ
ncbi:MAG: hypothetical protein M3011_00775 [Actinomycetota bacterium]|nr:hypothetical protein [Actinomycetota bacterium]